MDEQELQALCDAAAADDLDAALMLGLLDAELPAGDAGPLVAKLRAWQAGRAVAMQARERYRAKQKREQQRKDALRKKRSTALPSAAMQALERARQLAASKRQS